MKKSHLKKFALFGLATGLIAANEASAATQQATPAQATTTTNSKHGCNGKSSCKNQNGGQKSDSSTDQKSGDKKEYDLNSENEGYHLMTEDELFANINSKARALYESLDAEGKALALKVASQRCNGTNDCKGLNACKTDENDCAGKGKCKGHSKCAFADKNQAIKVVAKKMADKRADLQK